MGLGGVYPSQLQQLLRTLGGVTPPNTAAATLFDPLGGVHPGNQRFSTRGGVPPPDILPVHLQT